MVAPTTTDTNEGNSGQPPMTGPMGIRSTMCMHVLTCEGRSLASKAGMLGDPANPGQQARQVAALVLIAESYSRGFDL